MFHQKLIVLREIFQKNGYPQNFVDRCFKFFSSRIHILKEKVSTVETKPLLLSLPYLRTISRKLGLNCKSQSKVYLTAANYRLFLKVKINSVIVFPLKNLFRKFLYQVWFISISVDYAMNHITENV